MKYFTYIICGVVGAVVSIGFFFAGSPQKARLARLDELRLGHLQQIQYEIINYWQSKGHVPKSLDVLNDAMRGVVIQSDPQSGASYEYVQTGDLTFDLCAEFSRQGDSEFGYSMPMRPVRYPGKGMDAKNSIWQHPSGHHCFSRTIDKDFYPPLPKPELKK